ncbi:MAG: aminoacyl-tRNA hydrolase [Chloroflexi bacterium]|nr:aminoacyl-tRNA hydrolase [Chloroflexota bacterium]
MEPYLIAGLGNPGLQYAANRHNVGFQCVERLAALHGLTFDKRQKRALVALGTVHERRIILAKPRTFMNESGRAIVPLARFYKVPPERLLVVYDDLDLPQGTVRLRPEGGSGGHKGMRSIAEHLGGQGFPRLRIGIGRPPGRMDPATYVLQDFSAEETPLLEETLEHAIATVEAWLCEGVEIAMSRYNRGGKV